MRNLVITPDVSVELDDLIEIAREKDCEIDKSRKEMFIGNFGARKYPHIHVWKDGTIAFSSAQGINTKIGKDGTINIDKLIDARNRLGFHLDLGFKETIDFILSASN
ncbi:MAG: hypothetical protein MK066_01890 [Crocinitomicaceae bacterium]|nr:hypothetical protein [Crocinitomicaceae bacterium]